MRASLNGDVVLISPTSRDFTYMRAPSREVGLSRRTATIR
jgi:hypothetical protein